MDYGRNEFTTNAALKARRDDALQAGLPSKSGVYVAKAENAELWDVEGKRYIDFIGGIGVLNVGHRHPKVAAAIKRQVDSFLHTSFGIAQYDVRHIGGGPHFTPTRIDSCLRALRTAGAPHDCHMADRPDRACG